jgi:hypothetical protein
MTHGRVEPSKFSLTASILRLRSVDWKVMGTACCGCGTLVEASSLPILLFQRASSVGPRVELKRIAENLGFDALDVLVSLPGHFSLVPVSLPGNDSTSRNCII